jgi:hypothetical protein
MFLWLRAYLLKVQYLLSLNTNNSSLWYFLRLCTGTCHLRTKNTSQYNCSRFAGDLLTDFRSQQCLAPLCVRYSLWTKKGLVTALKMTHSNAFPHLVSSIWCHWLWTYVPLCGVASQVAHYITAWNFSQAIKHCIGTVTRRTISKTGALSRYKNRSTTPNSVKLWIQWQGQIRTG